MIFLTACIRPTNLETQQQAWSNYKQRCTLKYLVCVNPQGAVCFVSQAFGGRISDRQVVLRSGRCKADSQL